VPRPYKGNDSAEDCRCPSEKVKRARGSKHSSCTGVRKRGGDQRNKKDVEDALAIAMRAETDRTILLELIFDRMDPRPLAGIYLDSIMEVKTWDEKSKAALSTLRTSWFANLIRTWWLHSTVVGADTSWGMAREVALLLNFSPIDFEDTERLHLDYPLSVMRKQSEKFRDFVANGMLQIQQHPAFKALLAEVPPSTAIHLTCNTPNGLMLEVTNDAFDTYFRGADRMYNDIVLRKTMPCILYLGLVSPEDRREWTRFMIEAVSKGPLNANGEWRKTQIFKLVCTEGNIQLFLVKARFLPSVGTGSVAITLEPCPRSNHVTKIAGSTLKDGRKDEGKCLTTEIIRKSVSPSVHIMSEAAQIQEGVTGRSSESSSQDAQQKVSQSVRDDAFFLPGVATIPVGATPGMYERQTDVEAVFGRKDSPSSAVVPSFGSGDDGAARWIQAVELTMSQAEKEQVGRKLLRAPFSDGLAPTDLAGDPSSSIGHSMDSCSSGTVSITSTLSTSTQCGQQYEALENANSGLVPECAADWDSEPPVFDATLLDVVFEDGAEGT